MIADSAVREMLARSLSWNDAHAGFEATVKDLPSDLRGKRPPGLPYSAWEILEHLRIAQHDIFDFCVNPDYREMEWPKDYWPASPEPPSQEAWNDSIAAFVRDREAVGKLAADTSVDLAARIPWGTGQTYLREIVLIVDHNAYHIGQLVLIRRLLGSWR